MCISWVLCPKAIFGFLLSFFSRVIVYNKIAEKLFHIYIIYDIYDFSEVITEKKQKIKNS